MPRFKSVTKLETLSLNQFCKICAITCTSLEEKADDSQQPSTLVAEGKFKSFLILLPRQILEQVITKTLTIITSEVRKKRSHKGLIKAIECLPQRSVQKLDCASLYSQVRLYGHVNSRLKAMINRCFVSLPNLIELNLSSKCSDEMLIEVAKHCFQIEIINVALSDITDVGLMALAGISMRDLVKKSLGHGCYNLSNINVQNCAHITAKGVGCLLRNLSKLQYLYYDKLMDALETVIKVNREYLDGDERLGIVHIDQFGDFYEFESQPQGFAQAVAKICPKLESFRFFISDHGCQFLQHFPNIKHLQLEVSENVSEEFIGLTNKLTNLVSLQLTFRHIGHEALVEIGRQCLHIEVIKLIGYEIVSSDLTSFNTKNSDYFKRLRVLEIRIVRSDENLQDFIDVSDDDDTEYEDDSSINPALLDFFLSNCLGIQDLTISATLAFLNESFLLKLFDKNPMIELQRLSICTLDRSNQLTSSVASTIVMSLPNLHTMALSRWNMKSKEIQQLTLQCRRENLDVNFV